jgi:hypothetical protein
MATWKHCEHEIEHGQPCPACRAKLVRIARQPGGSMSVVQLGKLPATGDALDVVADPPAWRKSAEALVILAARKLPDPENDPEGFGLVTRARRRVSEVKRG